MGVDGLPGGHDRLVHGVVGVEALVEGPRPRLASVRHPAGGLAPERLEETNIERFERYAKIKATEQLAEEYLVDDADIVVVAFGASSRIARSAINKAREQGIKAGLIRPITLWPFPADAIGAAADRAKAILTVEMNMGQMVDDVRLVVEGRIPVEFFGRAGGIIPTPAETLAAIERLAASLEGGAR